MQPETIADRVRQIRREIGDPSQQAFGKPLGVTKSAVGQWEHGKTNPSAETILKIERIYRYRAQWIQTGELPKRVEPRGLVSCEPSNVSPGPPAADIDPRERSFLEIFRGLTPEQQDDIQRNAEEINRKNIEIFKALRRQIKDE